MTIKIKMHPGLLAEKLASAAIQDITYTADVGSGSLGNIITVEYVDPAVASQPLSISVLGSAIIVSLATNIGSAITSTAALIKTAVDGNANAALLVDTAISGLGATVQTTQLKTQLKGGKNSNTFSKGTAFYGIDPKKAVISISTGKIAEGWIKILSSGRSDPDGVKDGTSSLKVGRTGLEMTDVQFHYVINSSESFMTFGVQIVSLVEMGHVEVSQDGTPLTVTQIRAFTAP